METRKKIYKSIMLIVVVALVTFIITTVYISNNFKRTTGNSYSISLENLKLNSKLNIVKKILDDDYLGEIKDEEILIDSAVKGYVDGLGDKYTEYFSKEEMEEFKTETEGNYVGIGIYMMQNLEDNNIIVISSIKGSPAEEAGIKTGDIIKKVNGKEYTAEDFESVSSNIKGKEGTKVSIEIQRGKKVLNFEIERKKIELYPIETEVIQNKIGYINMPSFNDGCSKEFKNKYEELNKQKVESLIIDLRNNGGGILEEALEILDYILEKDSIMLITVDKNNKVEIEKAKKKPIITVPIVVLVNENTASASEIFASALKENSKATIIGTKTYGKGVIQELLTLIDGSGLKVTIEEYYTPNRNKINGVGVEPDITIELEDEGTLIVSKKKDTQLKKAIEILNKKKLK